MSKELDRPATFTNVIDRTHRAERGQDVYKDKSTLVYYI